MIREISAEMFLEYLYPEMRDRWNVVDKGVFYRNYSCDVLNVDRKAGTVELARDNFLRLLPQELLSSERELSALKNKKNADFDAVYEQLKRRQKLLSEAFGPFDTFEFRTRLDMERYLERVLEGKTDAVLKEVFGFDITQVRDEYVFQAALLLPYFPSMRGIPEFIRLLLSTVLDTEVTMKISDYSERDQTVFSMPKITYSLIMNGLDPEQFLQKCEEVRPLAGFVLERLAPADVFCEILIKGSDGGRKILDYNYSL